MLSDTRAWKYEEKYRPGVLGAELLVHGRVARAASASEGWDRNRSLYWRSDRQ